MRNLIHKLRIIIIELFWRCLMKGLVKTIVYIFLAIIAVSLIFALIRGLVQLVFALLPVAIIVIIGYFIYKEVIKKRTF